MVFPMGTIILSMMDTIVLFVSQVNQAIVAAPGVRMNDTFWFYFTADNGL